MVGAMLAVVQCDRPSRRYECPAMTPEQMFEGGEKTYITIGLNLV